MVLLQRMFAEDYLRQEKRRGQEEMMILPGGGNSVAAYTEKEIICPECDGIGEVFLPKKWEVLAYTYGEKIRQKINTLKEWEHNNGYVTCRNCNGDKTITVRQ